MNVAHIGETKPYEVLIGIDPRVLDTVETEQFESGYTLDPALVETNAGFAVHAVHKASQQLLNEVAADKAYLTGLMAGLNIREKIDASLRELGALEPRLGDGPDA